MVFYSVAIFLFFGALLEVCLAIQNKHAYVNHGTNAKLGYAALFLFLILFCGFRGEGVDRDYPEYLNILKQVPPFPDVLFYDMSDIHGDPILYFIAAIINLFNAPSFLFFLVFSVLSISVYWWCILRFSCLPWLSTFIYFCHPFLNKEMTQIRNGLSSAFVLLMLCYLSERKRVKATLACFLSFLAHSSGLVSLFFLFYRRGEQHKNTIYYFGFLLSFLMYFLWHSIFLMLPQGLSIVQKVSLYLAWSSYNYSLSLINPVLLRQVFFFLMFLHVKRKYFWDEKLNVFLFSYFLSICLYIVFNDTAILGARLSSMLSCSEYILIPYSVLSLLKYKSISFGLALFFVTITLSVALLYADLEIKNIFSDYNIVLDL